MPEESCFPDKLAGLRVLVIGDAMLDCYLGGSANRLAREAPVPVVAMETTEHAAGGAANTAVNAAALGAHTTLLAPVGDDGPGRTLQDVLGQHGVTLLSGSVRTGHRTLAKTRISAAGQMLVRLDEGASTADQDWDRAAIALLRQAWKRADAVILSDYGYGALTPGIIDAIARLQSNSPRVLAVDSKALQDYRRAQPTIAKPNYEQARDLVPDDEHAGHPDRASWIAAAAPNLLERTGASIVAITLDSDGSVVLQQGAEPYRTFVRSAESVRTIGAGDTYTAAFALATAAGASVREAADFATGAAQRVVRQDGTAICAPASGGHGADTRATGASERRDLVQQLEAARRNSKKLVLTNGVFDILHSGHVQYLREASTLGDILVVALNSDASVRRLKGPSRPVNTLADRMAVVSALDFVDHVVAFDELDPRRLIRLLRPDVFVKGGDYTREQLPEAALVEKLGGSVVILDHDAIHSTTRIIEQIRTQAGDTPQGKSRAPLRANT